MAITFVEQVKKQRYLIYIFLIVILITAFVIWRGFLAEEKLLEDQEEFKRPTKKIKIDFEAFKSPLLEELQVMEKISPIETGAEGRDNPFSPY